MNPTVSISCTTFNHGAYIKQCLDGFLMQKTTFPFEIIIHDDASTDNTREIIEEYTSKHPDRIFPLFQEVNQYSQGVRGMMFRFNFPRCRGKYIALCEGDDYWTDPLKLQKQIDLLESRPDVMTSVGRVNFFYQDKQELLPKKEFVNPDERQEYALSDYLKQPFSQTSTFVFRNRRIPMPDWMGEVTAGDQSMMVIFTGPEGIIHFHPEVLSVYRVNSNSITQSNILKVLLNNNNMFRHWNTYLNKKYDGLIRSRILENKLLIILFRIPGMQKLYKQYWFESCLQFVYKFIIGIKNLFWKKS